MHHGGTVIPSNIFLDRMLIVIKTQIVKEGKKPIAVVMDYKEYKRLKEIEEAEAYYL